MHTYLLLNQYSPVTRAHSSTAGKDARVQIHAGLALRKHIYILGVTTKIKFSKVNEFGTKMLSSMNAMQCTEVYYLNSHELHLYYNVRKRFAKPL